MVILYSTPSCLTLSSRNWVFRELSRKHYWDWRLLEEGTRILPLVGGESQILPFFQVGTQISPNINIFKKKALVMAQNAQRVKTNCRYVLVFCQSSEGTPWFCRSSDGEPYFADKNKINTPVIFSEWSFICEYYLHIVIFQASIFFGLQSRNTER